jgi:hypothetical protein
MSTRILLHYFMGTAVNAQMFQLYTQYTTAPISVSDIHQREMLYQELCNLLLLYE